RVAEIERVTDHDTAAFVDAVAEQLGPEGRWFHYGLTSSDVVDTALSLQIQAAGRLVLEGLSHAFAAVAARGAEHRARERVGRALEGLRVGKLSGAVGTYAATDPELERLACERLGLEAAPTST